MLKKIYWMVWLLAFALVFLPKASVPAAPQLSSSVSLISPISCPSDGCAAGQRLNFITSFDLQSYIPSEPPSEEKNIQVCLYTPQNWGISTAKFDGVGKLTASVYAPDITNCGLAPTNYELVGGVSTALSFDFFGDSLEFNFRLGATASDDGPSLIKVYEYDGTNWIETVQAFTFIPVVSSNNVMYVANDASTCSLNSPCYINSKDDLSGGIGTGLKDAIDVSGLNAIINILGNYQIKGNSVQINKPLTILGAQDAMITTENTNCINPMLSLENAITIQNLTIIDGGCNFTNRDLLLVNSTREINILSNNLVQGRDAIRILSNQQKITVRFNNIKNNSGYALYKPIDSGVGQIIMTANNILSNRTGAQVDCNELGEVNHNYWGLGILPETAAPSCTSSPGKRLGSPIIDNMNTAGVQAQRVTVTTDKTYHFENQIAIKRPVDLPETSDFDLYIVNHGNNPANAPFLTAGSLSTLVPCNNYYDIFLAETYQIDPVLEVFMKYDTNAACVANVESTTYCGQSNPALYPLWWYDPNQLITTGWNTTGQKPNGPSAGGTDGQVTTCSTLTKEISVIIDSSGRPGINNDLTYTPFVVGLVGQPAAAVLSSFSAIPGDMQVTINWSTSSELNTSGYYIQRKESDNPIFERISELIVKTGSNTSGGTYSFVDNDVINSTKYDYRLEIVGTNLLSVYSKIISATPIPPTETPTITLTPTTTLTPTITQTPTTTITLTRTITLTPTITNTRTITLTPTRTRYRTPTKSRTPFIIPYRSPTKSRTPFIINTSASGYPAPTNPSNQTDQGYPVSTNETPAPESGYPAPGDGTQVDGNYPGPSTQDPESTPAPQDGTVPNQTRTVFGGVNRPIPGDENGEVRINNWVYPLLGSMIGLSLVLLVGYFLWKKGYMALPIKSKNDSDEFISLDDEEN